VNTAEILLAGRKATINQSLEKKYGTINLIVFTSDFPISHRLIHIKKKTNGIIKLG
jgi:hypothetical protein